LKKNQYSVKLEQNLQIPIYGKEMTIDKAFEILDIFVKRPGEYGIVELANLTHLTVSTTHRIVAILLKRGFLFQKEKRGKYSLGYKFLEYSASVKKSVKIRDIVLPYLEKLALEVGESVNMAILDRDSAIYIDHIESNKTLRTFTAEGNRVPLHCTGVGKIFLSNMSDNEIKTTVKTLPGFTETTITTYRNLKRELKSVREQGIAFDNGEMEKGVRCLAAAVHDWDGKVIAAISVSGPESRLNDTQMKKIQPKVIKCSEQISRAMGYTQN